MKGDLVLHHVAEIDAVHKVVSGIFACARCVDAGHADTAGHGQKCAVVGAGHGGSRGQQGQVQEEAAVERNLDDLLVIDNVAEGGRFGLHTDRRSFHGHCRAGFAHLHEGIDAGAFVHAERKGVLHEGPEARLFRLQRIVPRPHHREFIVPFGVSLGRLANSGLTVGKGDGDVRHGRLLRVPSRSDQRCVLCRCGQYHAGETQHGRRNQM